MKVTIKGNLVLVDHEGVKFRSDTAFWYALKKHMNTHGFDLVKKVMAKDGHMVGGNDYPYYIRDRKWRFCILDNYYATRALHKAENPIRLTLNEWVQEGLAEKLLEK